MILQEIETACGSLADEIWSGSKKEDGFALLKAPRRINSILSHLKDETQEAFELYPEDLFWKINKYSLVEMTWETGLGSFWSIFAFCLPSGRRMYVQKDDYGTDPVVLSVSKKNWNPQIDLKFLQRLFKDNGASFGTGVISTPPNQVNVRSNSFPFIVDIFVAAFNAAGQKCWDALLDNWSVWNEEYENPENPIEPSRILDDEIIQEVKAKDIREHGTPKSLSSGTAHQARVKEALERLILRDEINEFISKTQFSRRSPQETQAKVQIVARYLCLVLGGQKAFPPIASIRLNSFA